MVALLEMFSARTAQKLGRADNVRALTNENAPAVVQKNTTPGSSVVQHGAVNLLGKRPHQEDAFAFGTADKNRSPANARAYINELLQEMQTSAKGETVPDGATANLVYAGADGNVTVGNLGDSAAFAIIRDKQTGQIEIQPLHDENHGLSEQNRIKHKNGTSSLNVSHALGDLDYPDMQGDPEIKTTDLSAYINDPSKEVFVLNGSDGLFGDYVNTADGKISEQQLARIIEAFFKENADKENIAELLAKYLSEQAGINGTDNITAQVLRLFRLENDFMMGTFDGHAGNKTSQMAANKMNEALGKPVVEYKASNNTPPADSVPDVTARHSWNIPRSRSFEEEITITDSNKPDGLLVDDVTRVEQMFEIGWNKIDPSKSSNTKLRHVLGYEMKDGELVIEFKENPLTFDATHIPSRMTVGKNIVLHTDGEVRETTTHLLGEVIRAAEPKGELSVNSSLDESGSAENVCIIARDLGEKKLTLCEEAKAAAAIAPPKTGIPQAKASVLTTNPIAIPAP